MKIINPRVTDSVGFVLGSGTLPRGDPSRTLRKTKNNIWPNPYMTATRFPLPMARHATLFCHRFFPLVSGRDLDTSTACRGDRQSLKKIQKSTATPCPIIFKRQIGFVSTLREKPSCFLRRNRTVQHIASNIRIFCFQLIDRRR